MPIRPTVLAVFCAIAVGAAPPVRPQDSLGAPTGPLLELQPPAAVGAAQPNLFADRTGRVWLSWLEPRDAGGRRLRLASLQNSTWSMPVTVTEGPNLLANWADFPSVFVASDGTIAVHWLETAAARGAYGIRVKTSRDGGRTWTAPMTPHRDDSATEHGFVSVFDAPGTGLGLIWLDGREMAGHGPTHAAGSMTLRAATLRDGAVANESLVDARVCDCCQTSAARTSDGVIVAYRDRTDQEIRDISVARFAKGQWTAPETVHADGWQITGCPVNGPVVTSSGDSVAVAWFAAAGGTSRAQVAFSTAGRAFSTPIRLDRDVNLGRLAMVMPAADRVLVSSIERASTGTASRLVIREARRDGRVSEPLGVGISADRSSGFARLALARTRLIVAWTEFNEGTPTRIHVAAAELR